MSVDQIANGAARNPGHHLGPHPMYGYQTTHKGPLEECRECWGERLSALELPSDMRLDPDVKQETGHLGWWRVIRDDGLKTVWQEEGSLLCPVCMADPEKTPDCAECVGRGEVYHVPFAERGWDEIIPKLYVGAHDIQEGEVYIKHGSPFRLVVSLYQRYGNDVPAGVKHLTHRMSDTDLDPKHHTKLDELAEEVAESVRAGKGVLVRCQAGLNRSSLVAGLAMLKLGYSADETITLIRQKRSPYALCNGSFVTYLKEKSRP